MEPTFWNTQIESIRAMGPPARPHRSDIACMRTMMLQRIASWPVPGRIKVLVLVVTAEIVGMDWPRGTDITAVDLGAPPLDAVTGHAVHTNLASAGEFECSLKSPYQILAHSNSVSQRNEREKPGSC